MSEQNKPNQSRRQLLKNIGLSVAAGAVAAGATTAVQASVTQPEEKKNDKTTGYRETQHVRDYYETL
ncbi:twin-arginine translocation signal domain-containing protein [Photobacterium nomapromontoriensis]|uniref:twin-arginine translocation signal domain-containing protein n=1 Tax=Photobacterium nomapromontoriensis TaxID=2910237 RepID=UPI003D0B0B9D